MAWRDLASHEKGRVNVKLQKAMQSCRHPGFVGGR